MSVCQMLTGSGGWPLTIVMTPDKRPFFAATYLPPETRYGRMGMRDLVPRIVELWQTDRDRVVDSAEQITARLTTISQPRAAAELDAKLPDRAVRELESRYDARRGGFGSAPKFPSPHNLILLARCSALTDNGAALAMVDHTITEMHRGGIFDQVGFGFHRYSTDADWLVPHFEKMLYDQAMMVLASTEAHLAGGGADHRRIVDEVATYVLRDMTDPAGGFYSAEDADSEGHEGTFYLWTVDELRKVLGDEDAAFAAALWNANNEGNFLEESTRERTGGNILHRRGDDGSDARRLGIEADELRERRERIREALFEHREQRVHPLKDDKVLADWNGLMAAALARAGRVFDEPRWVEAAGRSVAFVLGSMDVDGRLHHRWRNGSLSVPAFLDDHVFLVWALLELYDATLDPRHLEAALETQSAADELFWDPDHGGYFFSAADGETPLVRQKEVYDGAIPSGNSVAARNLVRLARLTARTELSERAEAVFSAFASDTSRGASAHSHMADAALLARSVSLEIVIAGEPAAADTAELLASVRERYLPNAALLLVPVGADGEIIRELAPFTAHHGPVRGRAAAYVCRDLSCRLPTTDPAELRRLLDEAAGAAPA
jgi:uncharacterized protein YyaL (SSP411 family)